jgi:hypothetical protein
MLILQMNSKRHYAAFSFSHLLISQHVQPSEKLMKLKKNRCDSAVTAMQLQSHQSPQNTQPEVASATQKIIATARRHRPSNTSATMRIPHELRAQVAAIVTAYRNQHRNDPDSWD